MRRLPTTTLATSVLFVAAVASASGGKENDDGARPKPAEPQRTEPQPERDVEAGARPEARRPVLPERSPMPNAGPGRTGSSDPSTAPPTDRNVTR